MITQSAYPPATKEELPFPDSLQKLIRCDTSDRHGEKGIRFVMLEQFSLWEYMMRTRHGIECRDYTICLWIPADEFKRKANLYEHCGNIETVTRFNFHLFDDVYHYIYTASRFVLEVDMERFRELMLSHVPDEIRESDRFSYDILPGVCIEKDNVQRRESIVLGIFNKFHTLY